MEFELKEIKNAYKRLKTYIFYDNTDILLRRKLVEFETNLTKDFNSIFGQSNIPYRKNMDFRTLSVEEKLEKITFELNNYHNSSDFFDYFINKVKVDFYPKKFPEKKTVENFITNKRIKEEYIVEKVTAFIDAPIEIHLLSTLWIVRNGVFLDMKLSENCIGNRLLLNQNKKGIIHGSGLFKPYYKQYQKWRDGSVRVAQDLLKNDKDVLFLNLDIKDYFHSVRIPKNAIVKEGSPVATYNLENLLFIVHQIYTTQISKNYHLPYDFFNELKTDEQGNLSEVILPIGLLSSYILANDYLKEFDKRVVEKFKPAYYGRYVDDILIVIADPNPNSNYEETDEEFKFSFEKYKEEINKKNNYSTISFKEKHLNETELYILSNLNPLLTLVDSPFNKSHEVKEGRVFKINSKKSLYCQSEKTLLYYFDSNESDLVISKLKKELEERTSEFRDLPSHDNSFDSFENNAYHLEYSGTEGKIRTLKDYQENRFGLTIYLTNQIFSSLRHRRALSNEERDKVLKFFKGENCLVFYRLWEKLFTFFIVNNDPNSYIEFYIHCAEQIDKIGNGKNIFIHNTNVKYELLKNSLAEYLDCAHELTISLNPFFLSESKAIEQNFHFKTEELKNSLLTNYLENRFTRSDSFWKNRFRETNMIRHQYVIIPLLNYTKNSKQGRSNLLDLNFNIETDLFDLDQQLIENSPRPLKFWECCMAITFELISQYRFSQTGTTSEFYEYVNLNILGPFISTEKEPFTDEKKVEKYYLDLAFTIYLKGNQNHLPHYILNKEDLKDDFFEIVNRNQKIEDKTQLKEFRFKGTERLKNPSISFANTEVTEENIIKGIRNQPNLSLNRYEKLASILKKARKEKSDFIIFPEFFIPINLFSSLVQYSIKNESLIISGLEHIISNQTAFNFVATIIPIEVNGITDATIIFRLKNHYAHSEEELIKRNHLTIPKPKTYRYDIINWKNIYFSTFYCFELADLEHRSLLRSKIDILFSVEWNKDTPYFSNIVESGSRDLHCYLAQVNTSQFGDSRLTRPSETARKDILRLKGGKNDAILVTNIDIYSLREFQRKRFSPTEKDFKPLPPNFDYTEVLKRINNQNITL